jgi:hypothetical protein
MNNTAQFSDMANTLTLNGGPSSQYNSGAMGTECLVTCKIPTIGSTACKVSGKPGQTQNDWTTLHNDGGDISNKERLCS